MLHFDREHALSVISDMSKDAYGFRVRKDWDRMTNAQLIDEMNHYADVTRESIRAERLQHEQAARDWEAHLALLVEIGAGTRGDAIRWDAEALGAEDAGHYCYLSGLPYSYETEVGQLLSGRG